MHIKEFDYFILRCLALGMKLREIAACLHYSTSAVGLRVIILRERYHAKTTRELIRTLLGD